MGLSVLVRRTLVIKRAEPAIGLDDSLEWFV